MKRKQHIIFMLIIIAVLCTMFFVLSACGKKSNEEINAYNKYFIQSTALIDKDINVDEIMHDQGDIFMQPLEPTSEENVTVRIRVRRGNIKTAYLEFTVDLDKEFEDVTWNRVDMYFERSDVNGYYDYFIGVIPAQVSPYRYHFVLENKKEIVYVNGNETSYSADGTSPFNTVNGDFYVMPDFKTPDWAKGALWYGIMPDSFFNGDTLNDKTTSGVIVQMPWGSNHNSGNDYLGGDLIGIEQKIDYLKELGVTAVFINPINVTYHNAGYGGYDMTQIDSNFGNDQTLKNLVEALHYNDMYVMLDGVFTYFSNSSIYYNSIGIWPLEGGEVQGTPYYDLFERQQDGTPAIVWGSPRLDFSQKITRETVYTMPDSIMQWYMTEHGIDGWRLDVGSDLTGSDPNNWGTPGKIIQDMRRYIKAIDEDKFLLSEGANYADMYTDYGLDSFWNTNFQSSMRSWLNGVNTGNTLYALEESLANAILRLPRSVGNASYNYTSNHDWARALYLSDGNTNMVRAAYITLMTYMGAPCIYFGDEVGLDGMPNPGITGATEVGAAPSSFGSMNWDESTWNYEMFNTVKALGQLRSDFNSVYKDGVLLRYGVDIDKNLLTFARWKGRDKTITIMNPDSKTVKGFEVNVRRIEMPDGAKLYDYLSGREYVVQNGKVVVDVISGGAVLVNRDINKWAGTLEILRTGGNESRISKVDDNRYFLQGNGNIFEGSDAFTFAFRKQYNNSSVSFTIENTAGSYAVMMRGGDSANSTFYAVVVDGSNLKIVARSKDGQTPQTITTMRVQAGDTFKILRNSDDTVSLYRNYGNDYAVVSGTETHVKLGYVIYTGIAPLRGDSYISNVLFAAEQAQLSTEFNASSDSMFFSVGNENYMNVTNGTLNISSNGSLNAKVTQAPVGDFTVKASFGATVNENDFAGVIAMQSESNYIAAGKTVMNGEKVLFVANVINGIPNIYSTVPDVYDNVVVQLEKTGAYWSAKYLKDDGKFALIGDGILANYSDVNAGVFATGKAQATFDYFCFGNAIQDGASYSDHALYGEISYSFDNITYVRPKISYKTESGSWEYVNGGIKQTSATAVNSKLQVGNVVFGSFKADFTLKITEASSSGYTGFSFGSGEYLLKLTATGELVLIQRRTELNRVTIDGFETGKAYRFLVIGLENGKISVYFKEDPILIMDVENTGYTEGTMAIEGGLCAYELSAYNFFYYYSDWALGNGNVISTFDSLVLDASTTSYAWSSLTTASSSNVILSANIQLNALNILNDAVFGYLIGGSAGNTPKDGGLLVSIDSNGTLSISEKGTVLTSTKINVDVKSFFMVVVVQNCEIKIYVDAYEDGDENGKPIVSRTPVIKYSDDRARGGSLGFYTEFARTSLTYLSIYGLAPDEDYTKLPVFLNRTIDTPPLAEPRVPNTDAFENAGTNLISFDFDSKNDVYEFRKYSGVWGVNPIENSITGFGSGNWTTGITIANGKFTNYELTYSVKVDATDAWAGVLVNKTSPTDTHEGSGILLFSSKSGTGVTMMAGGADINIGVASADKNGYMKVIVRSYGAENDRKLEVILNGVSYIYDIAALNRDTATSGYISLVAGNCQASFKDVSVRLLNSDGTYA